MKCTLEKNNARVIAKALQSLAKFGADLFVEADMEGLEFKTYNQSKSAVGIFRFYRIFFETYSVTEGDGNCCRVSLKNMLIHFKNMKTVQRCEIQILPEQSKLSVKFHCRLETEKSGWLSIVDDENLQPTVSVTDTSNSIIGSYEIFNNISNNFNPSEVEITLEAMGDALTAKNYIEGSRVNDKFMRSQLKLSSNEFQTYSIEHESAITFSLREFRAFLAFAETINEAVALNFDEAGDPVFVTIKKQDYIECVLITSTLAADDISYSEDCRETENINESTRTTSINQTKRKNSNPKINKEPPTRKKKINDQTTLSNNSTLFQFNDHNTNNNDTQLHSLEAARNLTQQDIEMDDDQDDILMAAVAATTVPQQRRTVYPERQSEAFPILINEEQSDNEAEDDAIPQSPEREDRNIRLRSIFARCFEATYIPKEPSPNSQVYVPNSDTEDCV